jgi:tetratricopeptide (TPR) repeat protein
VRVTAQLIDATTGHHLWAERYDRDLDDIFAVQDEITMQVVTALEVMLTRGEQARIWRKHAGNLEAYEYFERGRDLYMMFNRRANEQAIQLLTRALELSPEFTSAMAFLGWAHHSQGHYGWSKLPEEGYRRAEQLAHRILEIEDTCGSGHALLASVHISNGRHDAAIAEAEKAVALEPNGADLHHMLAMANGYAGHFDEAIYCEKQALRLSPLASENSCTELARAYCHLGRAEEAIQVLKRGLNSRPRWMTFRTLLVFAYVEAGMSDESEEQVAKILCMNPKFSIRNWAKLHRYKNSAELERYMDALRRAGLPE